MSEYSPQHKSITGSSAPDRGTTSAQVMLADDLTKEQKDAAKNTGKSYAQVKAEAKAEALGVAAAAASQDQITRSKEGVTSYYTPLTQSQKDIRYAEYQARLASGKTGKSQSTQQVDAYVNKNSNKSSNKSAPAVPLLAEDGKTAIKQIEFGKGNSHAVGIRGVAMQLDAAGNITDKKAISDAERKRAYKERVESGKPNRKTNKAWKDKLEGTARSMITSDSVMTAQKIEKYANMAITNGTNAIDRRRINLARNVIYASLPESQRETYYQQMKDYDNSIKEYKAKTGFSDSKINKIITGKIKDPNAVDYGASVVGWDTSTEKSKEFIKSIDKAAITRGHLEEYVNTGSKTLKPVREVLAKGYEMTYDLSPEEMGKSMVTGAMAGSYAGLPGAAVGAIAGMGLYIVEDDLNAFIPDVSTSDVAKFRDKHVSEKTTKAVQNKIESNIVTSAAAELSRDTFNLVGKDPVTAGRELVDLVAKTRAWSFGAGVATEGLSFTIGTAGKYTKYTPKLAKYAPESMPIFSPSLSGKVTNLPITKSHMKYIDDAISASEGAIVAHRDAVASVVGAGVGFGFVKSQYDKTASSEELGGKRQATKDVVSLVAMAPFGGADFRKGQSAFKGAVDTKRFISGKLAGKEYIAPEKLIDADVLAGKQPEAYFNNDMTIKDVIKQAEVLDKYGNPTGEYGGYNAADVPMETWTGKDGIIRSDARAVQRPWKDTPGTYISPEQSGAQVFFLRFNDAEAYTYADVIKELGTFNRAMKNVLKSSEVEDAHAIRKPAWYNEPVKSSYDKSKRGVGSQYLIDTTKAAELERNRLVESIGAVSELSKKVFGDPDALTPTISHITSAEAPVRFSGEAVKLATKNPNKPIVKGTKIIDKDFNTGLKLAETEIRNAENIGKVFVTLITEKKIGIATAEAELQIAPNTVISKNMNKKGGYTWYKNRYINIPEYVIRELDNASSVAEKKSIFNNYISSLEKTATVNSKSKNISSKNISNKNIKDKSSSSSYKPLKVGYATKSINSALGTVLKYIGSTKLIQDSVYKNGIDTYKPKPNVQIGNKYKQGTKYTPSKKYPKAEKYTPSEKYAPNKKYPASKKYTPASKYPSVNKYQPASKYTPAEKYSPAVKYSPSTKYGTNKKYIPPDKIIKPPIKRKSKKRENETINESKKIIKAYRSFSNTLGSFESMFGTSIKPKPVTKPKAKPVTPKKTKARSQSTRKQRK